MIRPVLGATLSELRQATSTIDVVGEFIASGEKVTEERYKEITKEFREQIGTLHDILTKSRIKTLPGEEESHVWEAYHEANEDLIHLMTCPQRGEHYGLYCGYYEGRPALIVTDYEHEMINFGMGNGSERTGTTHARPVFLVVDDDIRAKLTTHYGGSFLSDKTVISKRPSMYDFPGEDYE